MMVALRTKRRKGRQAAKKGAIKRTPSGAAKAAPVGLDLVDAVRAGEVRAIARMISLAEGAKPEARAALAAIYRLAGRAHVVGLTGVPGSGKSTLVRSLAKALRAEEKKVGIVAIDPSSPFSGGAILGDRVRMTGLTGDPGVFIRSMATRGALGGLSGACLDAIDVLDAAGFDVIVVETVGVGQDEVEIVQAAHTVVVVSAPGLGDEIQAIKAGVLEIADIHVVSKADRPDAARTVADLKGMLGLGTRARDSAWTVPVIATSGETGEGVPALVSAIAAHRDYLSHSGEIARRRERILERRILKTAEDLVRRRFKNEREHRLAQVMAKVRAHELDPYAAAEMLLASAQKPRKA
jgi:LAO/AO transport system kinase